MKTTSRIYVIVEDANGAPVKGADVQLRAAGSKKYKKLGTTSDAGVVHAEGLEPGRYDLEVSKPKSKLQDEHRTVELTAGSKTVTVVLGRKGQPFYVAGETKVYFEPDERSFLLVSRGPEAPDVTRDRLNRRGLKAEPLPAVLTPANGNGEAAQPADVSYVRVELEDGDNGEAEERMQAVVSDLEQQGLTARLARPVRRGERPIQGLTNELTVRFEDHVTREDVQRIAREVGLRVERPILYAGNAFLLARPGAPTYELLSIAQTLREKFPVRYAEPNLLMQLELDQYTPNDTLWANLNHLPLINCDEAWDTLDDIAVDLRGGSADVTVAVFDPHGVAPNHPDLTATLTDGTSKLVTSFDFSAMAAQTVGSLGGDHGTQCAGTATAAFDNGRGTAGVAPNCHLIGARLPSPATGIEMADAFIWAAGFNTGATAVGFPALPARPADVISNSWGVTGGALSSALRDCFDFLTVYGRGGRGCVVTFSTGNLGHIQFSALRQYAAYERTIAVGASINSNPTSPVNSFHADPNGNTNNLAVAVDTRALYSPFGPEMDIVAPSHTAYAPGTGTIIDPTTTCVRVGTGALDGCAGPTTCNDYDATFGGTSHASPTIAGAAALVISTDPSLTWVEVREILRTTANRIDFANTDPIGQWVDNDGDGVNEFSQWYGFGRVDVDAAVIAARDGTLNADIVVRENLSDTGAVPSTGWHAHSPDIWVRQTDDPIPALAYGANPPHQNPKRGQDNYVFCRVRNVGTGASNEVYIRAMITHFPGFEFRYPEEFIPTNRPGDPVPSPLTPGTYLIDEIRIDNLAAGADQIVKMTWPQALIPPATVTVGGSTVSWHPCLLIEVSPHDGPDPAGATFDIKRDNNIAQRNITILDADDASGDLFHAIMVGTSARSGIDRLYVDRSRLPAGARVVMHLADPRLMRRLRKYVDEMQNGAAEEKEKHCSIRLLTKARVAVKCGDDEAVVVTAPAGTHFNLGSRTDGQAPSLKLGTYRSLDVVEIGEAQGAVELPIALEANTFTPLLVAVPGIHGQGGGELRLSQRRGDGELSPGYTLTT
ncbi:MAG: S8 family serine peptidase [Bacteroidetes bacterium]|jgi:hypothetical protein|nr:S8 family serine peptidase [Bacteroidota bacterium]